MLPTQTNKMHLLMMMMMVMMMDFMTLTVAQPRCDPLTQYEKDGECCKMCGPGTRMSADNCLDPQCTECGDNEYQDKYTQERKCQRQPYCDPNLNFEAPVHASKKKRSTCMCKEGFHCSSEECMTCLPHTACKPGHGARYKGNHTHDTVCQKCSEGTFSDDRSWDGVCKKWTECTDGHQVQQSGTDVSDNICEETSRMHVIVYVCVGIVAVLVLVGVGFYCLCKGKPGDAKEKVKACFESCQGVQREPLRETKVLITNPTPEEESMMPEMQSSQEEASVRTPEENEDELSQEVSGDVLFTENGKFVTQENGKSVILSRQESQTQTFTD